MKRTATLMQGGEDVSCKYDGCTPDDMVEHVVGRSCNQNQLQCRGDHRKNTQPAAEGEVALFLELEVKSENQVLL